MTTADQIQRAHPSRQEIDDVLAPQMTVALGTLNDDGSIHLTYLLFRYDQGRFLLKTAGFTEADLGRPYGELWRE